jgi:hypothetical protein
MINVQRLTGWDFPPLQHIPGMLRTNAVVNSEYVVGSRRWDLCLGHQ